MWIFSHFQASRDYLEHRSKIRFDLFEAEIRNELMLEQVAGKTALYSIERFSTLIFTYGVRVIVPTHDQIEREVESCVDSIRFCIDSVIRGEIGGISFLESFELMNHISDQVCKILAFDCRGRFRLGDLVRNLKYEYFGSTAEYLVVDIDEYTLSKYPNELYFIHIVGPGTTEEEKLHPPDMALPILNLDVQFCGRMSIEQMLTHPHPLGRALALKLMDSHDSHSVSRPKPQPVIDETDVPF